LVELRASRIHLAEDLDRLWRKVMKSYDIDQLAIEEVHRAHPRATEAHGVSGDCVEDRLDVARRASDDPQNFRGRRLLLQGLRKMLSRLAEFAGLLVKLFLEVG
jgi:hypothetical protein